MYRRCKVVLFLLNTKYSRQIPQVIAKLYEKDSKRSRKEHGTPISPPGFESDLTWEATLLSANMQEKASILFFPLQSSFWEQNNSSRASGHWTSVNIWLLWVVISGNAYCCWQMTGCKFRALTQRLTGSLWTPRRRGDLHEHDRLQQGPAAVLLLDCGQAARLPRQRGSGLAIPGAGNLHLIFTGRVWSSVSCIWMRFPWLRCSHIFLQIFEQVISISFYSFP